MPANYDVLGRFLDAYSSAINSGFGLIGGDVRATLSILIAIAIAVTAIFWVLDETSNIIAPLFRQIMKIGIFVWIVNDWQGLTQTIIEGFAAIGLKAGQSGVSTSTFLNQPGNIVVLGFKHALNEWNLIAQLTGPVDFFINLPSILVLAISAIGVILAFFVIAVQLVVTLIEFRLVTLAAFVLVPFGVLNKTSFLAERAFGYVVSSGLKVLTIALVVMIGGKTFDSIALVTMGDKDWMFMQAMSVLLAALLLMMLSLTIPATASALVAGGPQLGAGGAVAGAAGLAAGAGAAYLAAKGAIAAPAAIAQRAQAAAGATFGKNIDNMASGLKGMGAAPPAGGGGGTPSSAGGGGSSGGSGSGGSGSPNSAGGGSNLPPSAEARSSGGNASSDQSSSGDGGSSASPSNQSSSGAADASAASADSAQSSAAPADTSSGGPASSGPASTSAAGDSDAGAAETTGPGDAGRSAPAGAGQEGAGRSAQSGSPEPSTRTASDLAADPATGADPKEETESKQPSAAPSSAPPPDVTVARAKQRSNNRTLTRAAQTAAALSNGQGGAGMTAKFNETEE